MFFERSRPPPWLANGASRIVMVRTVEEALALRDAGIGQICMGEVGGKPPAGFDFGNSPFEISGVDFHSKTIVQRNERRHSRDCSGGKPRRLTVRYLPGDGRGGLSAPLDPAHPIRSPSWRWARTD
jgi:hypothetical protein